VRDDAQRAFPALVERLPGLRCLHGQNLRRRALRSQSPTVADPARRALHRSNRWRTDPALRLVR
jgi:hypothetical protein